MSDWAVALISAGAAIAGGASAQFLNARYQTQTWRRDEKMRAYRRLLTALDEAVWVLRDPDATESQRYAATDEIRKARADVRLATSSAFMQSLEGPIGEISGAIVGNDLERALPLHIMLLTALRQDLGLK
jgi:hypothetical protein